MHNLSYSTKTIRIRPNGAALTVAAGHGDTLTSDVVDTGGFSAVRLMLAVGAITATAVTTMQVVGSNDNATFTNVAGATVNIADSDEGKVAIIDLYKPLARYFKVVTTRATADAAIDGLYVECYHPTQAPVTQDTSVAETPVVLVSATCTS